MTASQLVNQLSKRKVEVIDFLSKLLVESGVLEAKVVEVEQVVAKIVEVKPEEVKALEERIENLLNDARQFTEEKAALSKQLADVTAKVQRNLTDKERAELREALNGALKAFIAKDAATAADKFISLQVKVSELDTLQDKLTIITKETK